MIDWIGYGWMAGEVSGPGTFFADLTIEVPRGDVLAAAAVTGSSIGVYQHEPGSVAVYVREYGRFKSSTLIDVVDVPPDPTNNVMVITDCAFVRFRMTVFQGHAFSQGLVFRQAPPPPKSTVQIGKLLASDFHVRVGGKMVGRHRLLTLPRGGRLRPDAVLKRSAAEAARYLNVKPREIEVARASRRREPMRGSGGGPEIF